MKKIFKSRSSQNLESQNKLGFHDFKSYLLCVEIQWAFSTKNQLLSEISLALDRRGWKSSNKYAHCLRGGFDKARGKLIRLEGRFQLVLRTLQLV